MTDSNLLFTPGPVKMGHDILALGSKQPPYFRTDKFSNILKFCTTELLKMVNAEEKSNCLFLSCSGSGAMDAVISNFLNRDNNSVIVNGGTFGNRFIEISKFYEFNFSEIKLEFGRTITKDNLDGIELNEHSIFMIQGHETSSGVKHDLELTGKYCKENHLLHIVDGITSFLVDEIDMQRQKIDVLIIGSQKGLALPPGLSIVILSPLAIQMVKKNTSSSYYFNFQKYLDNSTRFQTPFTPPVSIIIQLKKRIENILLNGGVQFEINKCKERAFYFREKIINFPLKMISDSQSNGITTLSPTDGKNALEIVNDFDEKYQISICPNGDPYSKLVFRVSHMGETTIKDLDYLIDSFYKYYNS